MKLTKEHIAMPCEIKGLSIISSPYNAPVFYIIKMKTKKDKQFAHIHISDNGTILEVPASKIIIAKPAPPHKCNCDYCEET